jgi:hypothetical protein
MVSDHFLEMGSNWEADFNFVYLIPVRNLYMSLVAGHIVAR